MDKNIIHQLHGDFERHSNTDEASGVEYWFARDLQKLLGYSQWRNFEPVIEKAIAACVNAGENPDDHFARARKMIETGKTAQREVEEIALTRYACYLIAQNGDPRKTEIAREKQVVLKLRPERATHISPGQRPGLRGVSPNNRRPVRARECWDCLALTGRLNSVGHKTQGGGEYALPWAKMFRPYRAESCASRVRINLIPLITNH